MVPLLRHQNKLLTETEVMQSLLEYGPRRGSHMGPRSCAREREEHSISKSRTGNDVSQAVQLEEGERRAN